jgi:hypothetical protein
MSDERWAYPDELGEVLLTLGLRPHGSTPPAVVRDALNDLYRFELRRMRDRLRAGWMEKPEYLDHVVALRKKYWPLTLPLPAWERICRARREEAEQ